MAGDKKELDTKVIDETRKYLASIFRDSDKEMLTGIKVFERFKSELFKKNMLVRG